MGASLTLEITLLAAVVVAAALVALTVAFLLIRRPGGDSAEGLTLLQQQLNALRSELSGYMQHQSAQLEQAHETMGVRLDRASSSVAEVRQQLGVLEQATERVLEVGKTVAGIENLLRAPKPRGVLGEVLLGELLRQVLPPALFELQYTFKSGERVDAAVRVGENILAIDAKFPLENLRRADEASGAERDSLLRAFTRDVRKHVDAVASKYIVPGEGTLPLAFLYVPAENVYQQAVLSDWDLAEYAVSQRVVPMGPLGLYAFLQSALLGSRAIAVPAQSREILAGLEQLTIDLKQLEEEMAKLARHLGLARNNLEQMERRTGHLSETVDRARSSLDVTTPVSRD
jgi:DNA recombination protein RmuC